MEEKPRNITLPDNIRATYTEKKVKNNAGRASGQSNHLRTSNSQTGYAYEYPCFKAERKHGSCAGLASSSLRNRPDRRACQQLPCPERHTCSRQQDGCEVWRTAQQKMEGYDVYKTFSFQKKSETVCFSKGYRVKICAKSAQARETRKPQTLTRKTSWKKYTGKSTESVSTTRY